jgi:hypothetical protein
LGVPSFATFTHRPTTPHNANEDTILEPNRNSPAETDNSLPNPDSFKYILKKNTSNLNLSKQLNATASESGLKTLKQLRIDPIEPENSKLQIPTPTDGKARPKRNSYFTKF